MAKFILNSNFGKYCNKIYALGTDEMKICRGGAGEGAKLALDAIHNSILNIPVVEYNANTKMVNGISKAEQIGLIDGLGATNMTEENGYVYTKIGFAGYNSHVTKAYPKGHANAMIARAVARGTSWRKRYPFVDRALNPQQIIDAIDGYVEKRIKQIMK